MTTKSTNFRPYEGVTLDTPLAHFILKPILPILYPVFKVLCSIRWLLSQPLQIRPLPKWFPLIPGLKALPYVTVGQILLSFPLVLLFFVGYACAFVSPNLDRSGFVTFFAIVGAFVTANKSNSALSFLFGISFERMIPYHNLSSLLALILSGFHTYVAYVYGDDRRRLQDDHHIVSSDNHDDVFGTSDDNGSSALRQLGSSDSQFGMNGSNPDFVRFCYDGWTNLSGSLIVLSMVVLVGSSIFSFFRRWFFEFWLITHIGSACAVITFCVVHDVRLILIVAFWWGLDCFLRYIFMAVVRYPHKALLTKISKDIVEVRFPKPSGFDYNAGQFVQIAVPQLSPIEFHPITISSAPHEADVTLHIRALGGWTKKLLKLADQGSKDIFILLEGPYGCLSVDIDNDNKYKMGLMVCGGIGVTPCQSLTRSILYQHNIMGRKLQKIRFVWALRDTEMAVAMPPPSSITDHDSGNNTAAMALDDDIELSSTPVEDAGQNGLIQTDVYLTKQNASDVEQNIATPFHLHTGRPDLDMIFQQLKDEATHHGLTNVAVFGCGPTAMIDNVREMCRKHSRSELDCRAEGNRVKFDLHEELFEF